MSTIDRIFQSLGFLAPQTGLRECHLFDMRRKYSDRAAIGCSQFAASPPRTESCLFSLGRIHRVLIMQFTPSQTVRRWKEKLTTFLDALASLAFKLSQTN